MPWASVIPRKVGAARHGSRARLVDRGLVDDLDCLVAEGRHSPKKNPAVAILIRVASALRYFNRTAARSPDAGSLGLRPTTGGQSKPEGRGEPTRFFFPSGESPFGWCAAGSRECAGGDVEMGNAVKDDSLRYARRFRDSMLMPLGLLACSLSCPVPSAAGIDWSGVGCSRRGQVNMFALFSRCPDPPRDCSDWGKYNLVGGCQICCSALCLSCFEMEAERCAKQVVFDAGLGEGKVEGPKRPRDDGRWRGLGVLGSVRSALHCLSSRATQTNSQQVQCRRCQVGFCG